MDSAVLLALETDRYGPEAVGCLSFRYGARHEDPEMEAAAAVAAHYGVPRAELTVPIGQWNIESALLAGHGGDLIGAPTVVPFRNGILIAVAAGYALSAGADCVLFGAHAGDAAIYPDCRRGFVSAMGEAVRFGTAGEVHFSAPFVEDGRSKGWIAEVGRKMGVPLALTWSCYAGQDRACGKCGACMERRDALGANRHPERG